MTTCYDAFLDMLSLYYTTSDFNDLTCKGFVFASGLTLEQIRIYTDEVAEEWPDTATAEDYQKEFINDLNDYRDFIAELVGTTEKVVLTKGVKEGYILKELEKIFS